MRLTKPLFLPAALLAAFLLVGCSGDKDEKKPVGGTPAGTPGDKKAEEKKEEHPHAHEGPHEGVLAEWGKEEYHPEFTVDHKTKKATVYILGPDAKKAAPIEAESITVTITNVKPPVPITLKADPQKDDPQGKASRFSGTHDKLGEVMDFKGEISGKVGDKPYTGPFEEKEHKKEEKK